MPMPSRRVPPPPTALPLPTAPPPAQALTSAPSSPSAFLVGAPGAAAGGADRGEEAGQAMMSFSSGGGASVLSGGMGVDEAPAMTTISSSSGPPSPMKTGQVREALEFAIGSYIGNGKQGRPDESPGRNGRKRLGVHRHVSPLSSSSKPALQDVGDSTPEPMSPPFATPNVGEYGRRSPIRTIEVSTNKFTVLLQETKAMLERLGNEHSSEVAALREQLSQQDGTASGELRPRHPASSGSTVGRAGTGGGGSTSYLSIPTGNPWGRQSSDSSSALFSNDRRSSTGPKFDGPAFSQVEEVSIDGSVTLRPVRAGSDAGSEEGPNPTSPSSYDALKALDKRLDRLDGLISGLTTGRRTSAAPAYNRIAPTMTGGTVAAAMTEQGSMFGTRGRYTEDLPKIDFRDGADLREKMRLVRASIAGSVPSMPPGTTSALESVRPSRPSRPSRHSSTEAAFAFRRQFERTTVAKVMWTIWHHLDDSTTSTIRGKVMVILILLSVVFSTVQTLTPDSDGVTPELAVEIIFDFIFTSELLLRFIVCPSRKMFFFDIHNVADMLAASNALLRFALLFSSLQGEHPLQKILRSTAPGLRLIKTVRYFEAFNLLLRAFAYALEALPVLLFTQAILVYLFSALIFIAESDNNEDIDTFSKAVWLTLVTMMTVGYGDITAESTGGRIVSSVLIVLSGLYTAIPFGIVGSAFGKVWEDRDRLLLMTRTRNLLVQGGYKPEDIRMFFQVFDRSHSGVLTVTDFKRMMEEMHIGLREDRIVELFSVFDGDRSGTIDCKEFVETLFPGVRFEDLL